MLEAAHLTCQRGEHTLFTDLNFNLAPGELLQLEGANGSGKTSLLKILCGLATPQEGAVRWRGMPPSDPQYRRELLYLGHLHAVKADLSAIENLRLASALGGEPTTEHALFDALAKLGLARREHLPAKVLSQGQRRRVALARLMLTRAPLWILDEPLAALDVAAVVLIQTRLGDHLAHGGTVVLTTHQPLRVTGASVRHITLNEL